MCAAGTRSRIDRWGAGGRARTAGSSIPRETARTECLISYVTIVLREGRSVEQKHNLAARAACSRTGPEGGDWEGSQWAPRIPATRRL